MKRSLFLVLAAALTMPLFAQDEEGPAVVQGAQVDTTGKGYTAAYVIEPTTGRVLFAENEHVPFPTASMAKMMTLLITMEEIAAGRLQWDTPVTVSAWAASMGGSQVYLRAASVWPVKNLVIATMVHSANDASMALAEKIAGSNEAFAELMNRRAEALKLDHSRFFDPHGLPARDPAQNDVMCAHDLAVLGIELMKHPFMRQLAIIPEMEFRNNTLARIYNPNRMVNPKRREYYPFATGIKTGYTGVAGYCITASAGRNDLELVGVVMGARTPIGPQSSFGIVARLFDEAFLNYRMVTPVKKGVVVGQVPVTKGRAASVPAVAARDVGALVKRGEEKSVNVSFSGGAVTAPVRPGQQVGMVVVTAGNETVARVPAVAGAEVEKQAWWQAFWPF
ncbi:MAG TPA: D-alanyl-D-alanine carboxypeptidase family protein [Thermoanaerobaculia bacterium]|nr:D-alanyl-D-alanine carboxypeptidase family protein [Thermoanaerobaculia bacterium]